MSRVSKNVIGQISYFKGQGSKAKYERPYVKYMSKSRGQISKQKGYGSHIKLKYERPELIG